MGSSFRGYSELLLCYRIRAQIILVWLGKSSCPNVLRTLVLASLGCCTKALLPGCRSLSQCQKTSMINVSSLSFWIMVVIPSCSNTVFCICSLLGSEAFLWKIGFCWLWLCVCIFFCQFLIRLELCMNCPIFKTPYSSLFNTSAKVCDSSRNRVAHRCSCLVTLRPCSCVAANPFPFIIMTSSNSIPLLQEQIAVGTLLCLLTVNVLICLTKTDEWSFEANYK